MTTRQLGETNINVLIGRRVYLARSSRYYYQTTLAEEIGISNSMISKIEDGTRILKADTLFKISMALKIEESQFNPYRDLSNWANPKLPLSTTHKDYS